MSVSVFIDGASGTTGLLIEDLLRNNHPEIAVRTLDGDDRKNGDAKRSLMAESDGAVLCLPDVAARESAQIAEALGVRVLDASSAHRVLPGWTYGLPELNAGKQRYEISSGWRVANPGCYATGALLLLNPLSMAGLLHHKAHVPIVGISGYSGGGRAMIDRFGGSTALRTASYAHDHEHKHVREIAAHAPLTRSPQFVPTVGGFERGMSVTILLGRESFTDTVTERTVNQLFTAAYSNEPYIEVASARPADHQGLLHVDDVVGTNTARVHCFDDGDNITLVCHLDNLGKGASLAAIQNLNIMFGYPEGLGIDH